MMIKGCAFSILFFLLLPAAGFSDPQETSKFLIDEQTSLRFHHEIDSLYLAGDYSKAIERVMILMVYYRNKNDLRGQIVCCNHMGDLLRASGSRSGSLDYLYKSLALNARLHDSLLLATTYNYLGSTYFEHDYPTYIDSTKAYAMLSMEAMASFQDEKLVYSNLNLLGKVEEGKGDLDRALFYLTQALEIVRRVNPIDEALVLSNMAGVYFRKGDLTRAKEMASRAYECAKRYNVNTYHRLTTYLLELIYLREGNFREAHRYLTEHFSSTRTFLDEKMEERVITLKEQILQAEEEEKIQKKLDQRRLLTVFLLILIGFALAFMTLFARQKNRLRKMNRELQTSNATLKNFISIIAHDLKNPFNTIIGFSDLLHTEMDTLSHEERKIAIENTHKSALSAYALLEQLLSWARMQTGAFRLEPATIGLRELIDEVINLFQTTAFLKKQTLTNQVSDGLYIRADRNMMLAVFRNLLSNAIKFTPHEGHIGVSATHSARTIQLFITDSGVGISKDGLGKLFNINEPYKTTGTNGEKGTGIGLLLCKEYLEKNRGTISVESAEGKGTTFSITLPRATA